ncbi:MAG: alpha-amylase family glycosyl hydrolase [Firmicutes bacterium]|nr:alpha-amylase family glycosyl hydrolase [Bacillota bacterium]
MSRNRYQALLVALTLLAGLATAGLFAPMPASAAQVTFTYAPLPGEKIESVSLRGNLNSWGETPMKPDPNGAWSVTLELAPGEYTYKFYINRQWPRDMATARNGGPVDPMADDYVDDGYGGQNAVRHIGGGQGDVAEKSGVGDSRISPGFLYHKADDRGYFNALPDGGLVVRANTGVDDIERATFIYDDGIAHLVPMKEISRAGQVAVWEARIPAAGAPKAPFKYCFRFEDGGAVAYLDQEGAGEGNKPRRLFTATAARLNPNAFPVIGWTKGAVFYQIFPDRFDNADHANDPASVTPWDGPVRRDTSSQYYGGDLKGIIRRIPYLKELGVTALYLNPIFAAGSSHRYDAADYLRVDPMLGTIGDFKELIKAAHASGMRVILDGVFNHTGINFWAFRDVMKNGKNSPYVDWYTFRGFPVDPSIPNYVGWAGLGSLPKLNVGNPKVKKYLLEVVAYWTRQGIDGWRLDVANEITAPGFWEDFRKTVKSLNPNAYILGEIWNVEPQWLQGTKFDALMNYPIGKDALRPFFAGQKGWTVSRMDNKIHQVFAAYPDQTVLMNFNLVDSHDTERILTSLGGGNYGEAATVGRARAIQQLKLLTAVQFTLPGMPVIWNGDERGMAGEKGDNWDAQRAPIQWDKPADEGLFKHYQKLIAIRKNEPGLWGADFTTLLTDDERGVYAFQRGSGAETIVVVVNNGNEAAEPALLLEGVAGTDGLAPWKDLLGGNPEAAIQEGSALRVPIAPHSAVLLKAG